MTDPLEIPAFLRRYHPTEETDHMARKPKKTDEAKTDNGIGHNGPPELTDEQKQALAIQHMKKYEALLATKKEADAAFKNGCKLIKAEVGPDGVDLIKDMIALRTEEGEAKIKADIERKMRAARWMAAPMGSQFEMFEDRTPAVDRAREEGKRDGMAGDTAVPQYDSGTPQYDAYMEGWHEGQKAIFDIQKIQDDAVFDQGETEQEMEAA